MQLDGRYGGADLVPMATRMFRTASARLASGKYPAALETDFTATVVELGEVAGWLAFDAMQRFRGARWDGKRADLSACGERVALAQPSELDWSLFPTCVTCNDILKEEGLSRRG